MTDQKPVTLEQCRALEEVSPEGLRAYPMLPATDDDMPLWFVDDDNRLMRVVEYEGVYAKTPYHDSKGYRWVIDNCNAEQPRPKIQPLTGDS